MSAHKPGPWATGLVTLTPIEAMRQDRKKLVTKIETLIAQRDALREALTDAALYFEALQPRMTDAGSLLVAQAQVRKARAALAGKGGTE